MTLGERSIRSVRETGCEGKNNCIKDKVSKWTYIVLLRLIPTILGYKKDRRRLNIVSYIISKILII